MLRFCRGSRVDLVTFSQEQVGCDRIQRVESLTLGRQFDDFGVTKGTRVLWGESVDCYVPDDGSRLIDVVSYVLCSLSGLR